jgi:hypothetical protein
LQPAFHGFDATPTRLAKKPDTVGWRLSASGVQRTFPQRRLESLLRLRCVTRHEEAKPIQLRQIFVSLEHAR